MIEFTPSDFLSDIPMSAAVQAHSGTSHVPEQRGESERQNYAEYMSTFFNAVLRLAGEEKYNEALSDLERYRQGYRDRHIGALRRRSRVMSAMIAGPANFPTRRNQKAGDSYESAVNDLVEWSNRVRSKIVAHYSGSETVRTGDANAVEALMDKLAKMEARHEFMRSANKVIKGKGTQEEKIDALLELDDDLTEAAAIKILTVPDCFNHIGFATFELTNSNARIKHVKEQLAKAQKLASQVTTETMIGAVRIVNNVEDDRLELYFPTRTSPELYKELSSHGFRYTPSKSAKPVGCFQAYRGANADHWAPLLAKQYNNENPE